MNILYIRIVLVAAIIAVAAYMLLPKPPEVLPCSSGYVPSSQNGGALICSTPKASFECAGSIVASGGYSVCGRDIENAGSIPGLTAGRLAELAAGNGVVQVKGTSWEWYRPCPDPPDFTGIGACDQVHRSIEVAELLAKPQ